MMHLLSKKEVAAYIGFHPEHVMRLARARHFPRPIKLGKAENSAVRFVAQEVEAWVAAKIAERDGLSSARRKKLVEASTAVPDALHS